MTQSEVEELRVREDSDSVSLKVGVLKFLL